MRDSRKVLAVLVAAASVLMSAASAYGAFPGTNGKIAYLELSSDGISRVHIINPDGSRETDISSAPASYSDFAPAWSPDGRTLAFSSNRDWIYQEIYTSNADGSNLTRITNDPAVKGGPSWSPDGTKIAYSGQCVGRQSGICVMNADGSGVTHIPNTDFRSSAGTWSPDGSKIAFLRKGDGGATTSTRSLSTELSSGSSRFWRKTASKTSHARSRVLPTGLPTAAGSRS